MSNHKNQKTQAEIVAQLKADHNPSVLPQGPGTSAQLELEAARAELAILRAALLGTKKACPITEEEFLASAEPIEITIVVSPKPFKTGSFGYQGEIKRDVEVGGKTVTLSNTVVLTVQGSKDPVKAAKHKAEQAAKETSKLLARNHVQN